MTDEINVNLNVDAPTLNADMEIGAQGGNVEDVRVNNVSVVADKVAYIDLTPYRTSASQDVIDDAIGERIDDIDDLIPSQATSSNQLADKDFVNSSITTNTAFFKGTFDIVNDLHLTRTSTHAEVSVALGNTISNPTNNDYSFVSIPNASGTSIEQYDRYKYTSEQSAWGYEFTLNNSSFTANQWNTINSGLTSSDKTKLDGISNGATNTSVSASGTSTDEIKYITIDGTEKKIGGGVNDVKVNNVSIVDGGMANIPLAKNGNGVVNLQSYVDPLYCENSGRVGIRSATENQIINRSGMWDYAITLSTYDIMVKHAMCDEIGTKPTTLSPKNIAWTSQEQANAQLRMGLLEYTAQEIDTLWESI